MQGIRCVVYVETALGHDAAHDNSTKKWDLLRVSHSDWVQRINRDHDAPQLALIGETCTPAAAPQREGAGVRMNHAIFRKGRQ